MGEILIQCAYEDCSKNFNLDFGAKPTKQGISFEIACPYCKKINVVALSISPKNVLTVRIPDDNGSITMVRIDHG